MSHGLQVWSSGGDLKLSITDRLLRLSALAQIALSGSDVFGSVALPAAPTADVYFLLCYVYTAPGGGQLLVWEAPLIKADLTTAYFWHGFGGYYTAGTAYLFMVGV